MVRSLASAAGRRNEGKFITERTKNVLELLYGKFNLSLLIATHEWFQTHQHLRLPDHKCLQATSADLERMSTLSTPPDVIAVFDLPRQTVNLSLDASVDSTKLYLALDHIQDPGNMGTIIRIADWFGVDTIYISKESVDPYNPKSIIASMGSIARVSVVECDLPEFLGHNSRHGINVWGATLNGENLYYMNESTIPAGIIVMGNEGHGLSPEVEQCVTASISIPRYPVGSSSAESLNVAMATAIILSEFRRRSILNT